MGALSRLVEALLGRLETVRKCGGGWIARCPAHEDRDASLSVGAGHDGRTLLHCFAGCSALEVVHTLGLELRDLFPNRCEARGMNSAERSATRQAARESQWAAALGVLSREATVVAVV